ncbi:FCD domain-containing protein [Nonomuraea sp. KM88]|uniref:FCD domain-containing protein n=1 Tax=Nonomuraea sp. KM88 TaxID=3457427 RepID=UPI003FCCFCF2
MRACRARRRERGGQHLEGRACPSPGCASGLARSRSLQEAEESRCTGARDQGEVTEQHRAIVAGIRAGDPEAAERAAKAHIEAAGRAYKPASENEPRAAAATQPTR